MGRMRVTKHNGRIRKSGAAYSPKHNDRNFDITKADNIDQSRTPLNRYWAIGSKKCYNHGETMPSFEDVERKYYEEHFMAMYEESRERSRKRGQLKRVKPFEEWRKARQFVPEESYLQIGSVEDGTVDIDTFKACASDYIKALNEWNKKNKRPFTMLNAALHCDEDVPQLHIRWVWHSVNPETGIDEIGQAKALERAGVSLPDPTKPCSNKNNRKMTFDAEMREEWLEICKNHGLDIETVPEPGRKHNQSKEQWITEKQKQREKELKEREKALEKRERDVNQTFSDTYFATAELRREKAALESEIDDIGEYKAWKAQRDAQKAAEAVRKEQEGQDAGTPQKAQKAPQKPQKAAEAAPETVTEPDPEEQAPQEPLRSSLVAGMLKRYEAAAKNKEVEKSGIGYPSM